MRILIYSQDGFGLGHLRRNLNICMQIKRRRADARFLIIADSPVAPFFKLPPQCEFVKIPTIVKVDTGVWRPNRLPMGYRDVLNIRAEIIQNVMMSFRPDVFLVDHMPHGALGELASCLEVLKRSCPQAKLFLGLRDILGAPEVIHRQWQQEGAFAAAMEFYDAVCVYGCADVFDVIREYRFPAPLARKTHYCGYVCRKSTKPARPDKKHHGRFGNGNGSFILVAGGGGADAAFFMDQFIDAFRLIHQHLPLHALITTGPFMKKDQSERLRHKAQGLPIAVSQKGEDSIQHLRRADLVVSMAGYNTISEILRFRKNAIVVPRPGPSAEQSMRSRLMSERGMFTTIHPSQLTPAHLAEQMVQKLRGNNRMNEAMLPNLQGAAEAANRMLSYD